MKRKILIVVYIILIVICIKLILKIGSNEILVNKYNNGDYSESQAEELATHKSLLQSYVANYNYGNILYKNGEYEEAMARYEMALEENVPENKECNIRINYALAVCETVVVDETSQASIISAISTYEAAIGILTENGCASEDDSGTGHCQEAETLKDDIQEEIERLKKLLKSNSGSSGNNNQKENDETEQEMDSIESKIQDIKESATKEQRELEEEYKNYSKNYNDKGKNW